jgi:hypothetical protein
MIKEPQPITKQQIIQFNTLVHKQNLTNQKAQMVGGATNGRTESSGKLYYNEAADLIKQLQAMQPVQQWKPKPGELQRRKIIAIAYNMHWEIPNPKGGKPIADMKRINDWCIKFGFGHKKLNDYTVQELPKLVSIFEIVYKQFLKGI